MHIILRKAAKIIFLSYVSIMLIIDNIAIVFISHQVEKSQGSRVDQAEII